MRIRFWPYPALLLELLLFYRQVLWQPSKYVIPWDFQYYAYNLTEFLAHSLRGGEFPLWDPFSYCGVPFFANMQAQVFYPPTLATVIMANLIDPSGLLHFMAIELVLHVFLAGMFTFWLLREMGCSRLAAFFGATAFQLGCFFASQTQHFGAILGAVWLPLSLFAVMRLAHARSARWIAILACSLAMPILAGYPSTIFPAVFCTALFALTFLRAGLLASTVIGVIGALGLTAIQLLPTIQAAQLSVSRFRADWRDLGSGGLPLEALASLIWPNYFHILDLNGYSLPYNFTFLYLYCGLTTLALAILSLLGRRSPYAIPFLIVTVVSTLLMFGNKTLAGRPLTRALLSVAQDTVYPEFMMVGVSLGIAVLAGLGAERIAHRPKLLGILAVLTIMDLTVAGSGRPMNTRSLQIEPGVTPRQMDGVPELVRAVRERANKTQPPSRLETYGDSMGWVGMAPAIRIPTASGNDPLAPIGVMQVRRLYTGGERWGRYYQVADLNSRILDLLNVRYIVSRQPLPVSGRYRLSAQLSGHLLYENTSALPRFFFVGRTIAVHDDEEGVARLGSAEFDPAKSAIVEGVPGCEYPASGESSMQTISYDQNAFELETVTSQARFLVTSEAYYPGWRATIDGKTAPIVRTNVAFRGLEIPAGRHRIAFRFNPSILWWGAAISVLTVVVCGACVRIGGPKRHSLEHRVV